MLHHLLRAQVLTVINKKPSKKQGFFFLYLFLFCIVWFFLLEVIHYECPFLKFFHIYCAGCGGTRMILALLQLNFYQAFRWNPLMFILFIIGFIYLIFMGIYYIKKKELIVPTIRVGIALLVLLVIYMILRNLDAFVYLIPTEV